MKVDENGVAFDIEESDIVDGVLIIPEGVKRIDWGKISKKYPPIKFAKIPENQLDREYNFYFGYRSSLVSVENGRVSENYYEEIINWLANLKEPYTIENNLEPGIVEPEEMLELKEELLYQKSLASEDTWKHNLDFQNKIYYAKRRVDELIEKIKKLARKLEENKNRGNVIPSIKSISFPSTIISIGSEAFAELDNLEEVIMPDSITELESSVFSRLFKIRTCSIVKKIRNNS